MNNEKKTTIALIVRYPVGGIRSYIKYIYDRPIFHGYGFILVVPQEYFDGDFQDYFKGMDIEYITFNNTSVSLIKTIFRLFRNQNIDLIHSHGFTAGALTALPAKLYHKIHIMTGHDIFNASQFNGFAGYFKKHLIESLFNLIDIIHTVSYDARDNFISNLTALKKNNIQTILNGIDTNRFIDIKPRDLRSELGLSENQFLFGFLGRFMAQKGFVYLVQAFSNIIAGVDSNKIPVVITVGSGGYKREEIDFIKRQGLEEYFYFLPQVNDVGPTIQAMDAIVMPSRWEACPLLPMEVLTIGTPLIASDCIGLREVTAGTPTIIFQNGDVDGLATALTKCLNNNYREIFNAYKKDAVHRYDIDDSAKKLENLYDGLIRVN